MGKGSINRTLATGYRNEKEYFTTRYSPDLLRRYFSGFLWCRYTYHFSPLSIFLMRRKIRRFFARQMKILWCALKERLIRISSSAGKWLFPKKSLIRDRTCCTGLYSPEKISELLRSVGLSSITIQKDFVSHKEKGDYGSMSNRMIVTAQRLLK